MMGGPRSRPNAHILWKSWESNTRSHDQWLDTLANEVNNNIRSTERRKWIFSGSVNTTEMNYLLKGIKSNLNKTLKCTGSREFHEFMGSVEVMAVSPIP